MSQDKRLLHIWSFFSDEVDMLVKHKLWERFNSSYGETKFIEQLSQYDNSTTCFNLCS